MKVKTAESIEARHFDNEVVKGVTGRVLIGKGDGAPNFCMRMFEIAPGGHTPKHSHDWEHEMFYHSGQGELLGGGEWRAVSAGSVAYVTPGEEHQIRNTGDVPLVLVCLVPATAPEL